MLVTTESTLLPVLVNTDVGMMVLMLIVHFVETDVLDVKPPQTTVPSVKLEDLVSQNVNVTTEPPKSTVNVPLVLITVTVVKMVIQKYVKTVLLHTSTPQNVTVHPEPIHSMTDVTNVNINVKNVLKLPETVTHVEVTESWTNVNAHLVTMKPLKQTVNLVTCTV